MYEYLLLVSFLSLYLAIPKQMGPPYGLGSAQDSFFPIKRELFLVTVAVVLPPGGSGSGLRKSTLRQFQLLLPLFKYIWIKLNPHPPTETRPPRLTASPKPKQFH